MNSLRHPLRTTVTTGLMTFLLCLSQTVHGALALPDAPLIIGTGPQPNIFFALDDSGSMDWEVLLNDTDGSFPLHGIGPNNGNLDISPSDADEDRELCVGYNRLAYDPNVTYTPWIGKDNAGNTFGDMSISSARINPSNPSSTVNLLDVEAGKATVYGIWTDNDNDGLYDEGECPVATNVGQTYADRDHTVDSRFVLVDTLSDDEQTNFANWYSYYRKREYVMKRAISEIIDRSDARMGLATLHDNNDVGTAIRDMTDQASKDTLLDRLFQVNSVGGTPLRRLLDNVGRYYDQGESTPSDLGFSESSPILPETEGGACQQNFTLLFSDGFWNGNHSGTGNTDGDDNTEFDGGPHADNLSNTLADVAIKYYENDLSSALDNIVPVVENSAGEVIDGNEAQHMVTYTVAFGLTGNGLTTPADHDPSTPPPPWPDSISDDSPETLDDMQHAAFNGRGLFLNAGDPLALIDALTAALGDIENRTSFSAAAVAINSTVLRTSSLLFQARFDSSDFSGELTAFSLNTDGTLDQQIWQATDNIPGATSRDIFTTVTKAGTPTAIEFTDGDADLIDAVDTATIDGADIINYIRGDQSGEQQNGGAFRDREELLGDIVNSSPLSVGRADFGYDVLPGSEGADYPAFLANKTNRFTDANSEPFSVVYVGSNDGMLHAFDSRDGGEQFAYVPSTVHGNLNLLTNPDYGHKFFVDATPGSADAFINGTWKTLLMGALGSGGRAVYALDITDPFGFGSNNVMWEFTSADNNELGFVMHQPQLVRLNNGRWGVIFGNGFNSNSERAQLFILDAEDGSLIRTINTGVGNAANTNGLSMPFILDENTDRIADTVYAGDLQGNLWKFDISGTNESQWDVAFKQGNTPVPLYTALDDNGTSGPSDDTAQPVTSRPTVVNHPDGGFVVLFGTGKYIENSDNLVPQDPPVQTFYGIRDNGAAVGSGRNILQEQLILADVDVTDANGDVVNTARVVTDTTVDYGTKNGWFIDLVSPTNGAEGERVIANPLTRFERVIFTTFIPGNTPCDQGGQSVLMELDAVSGNRLENAVFDFNNDGIIDSNDFVLHNGVRVPASGVYIPPTLVSPAVVSADDASVEFKQTSGIEADVTTTRESTAGSSVGRQSWRQLR